ncbi:MAG: hypothetical protein J6T20_06370 [Treponema sp.]|nr:hypothetical protein [Treponema sp.]
MIVIVPHRDLELKLINAQKKLIKEIFKGDNGITPYAIMPLWIPVDFKTVEQAKAEITKVTVLAPEYDDDEGCFFCPVKIECAGGDFLESKLDFVRGLPRSARNDEIGTFVPCNDVQSFRHCEERSDVAIQAYDETFPLSLKIFRLGECTSPKPGVYELSSTVWKKLTS